MARRRNFARNTGFRSYRKRFVLATEGRETEPGYFKWFSSRYSTLQIVLLNNKQKTSPGQVLQKLERAEITEKDSAWIVIDRDSWTAEELEAVAARCRKKGFKMAVSNPQFEYWLLLHFEDGAGVTARNVMSRLRKHLPAFTKSNVEMEKLKERVTDAIARAQKQDTSPDEEWPEKRGSTVYRLMVEILAAGEG